MMRRANLQVAGQPPLWQRNGGSPMSGVERNILDKNYQELRLMAQEALDDAILIGCSEEQVRDALHRLIDALSNSYKPSQKHCSGRHSLPIAEG